MIITKEFENNSTNFIDKLFKNNPIIGYTTIAIFVIILIVILTNIQQKSNIVDCTNIKNKNICNSFAILEKNSSQIDCKTLCKTHDLECLSAKRNDNSTNKVLTCSDTSSNLCFCGNSNSTNDCEWDNNKCNYFESKICSSTQDCPSDQTCYYMENSIGSNGLKGFCRNVPPQTNFCSDIDSLGKKVAVCGPCKGPDDTSCNCQPIDQSGNLTNNNYCSS